MKILYIDEKTTRRLTFVLKDEDDNNINLTALNSLQLTLYNKADNESSQYHLSTINGRYNQNVLNANNVTVSSTGTVIWTMQAADNQILDNTKSQEEHIAVFKWRYSTSKIGLAEIIFKVRNIMYIS